METIRAFIAIPLPDDVKNHLKDIQSKLRKSGIKGSWPKAPAMHLTLKFLGEVEKARIVDIKRCMTEAVKSAHALDLSISCIGGFPSMNRARTIWAGLLGQKENLISLAHLLDTLLAKEVGLKRDKKQYSPHLTLARATWPVNLNKLKMVRAHSGGGVNKVGLSVLSKSFRVSEMILYKSILLSSGAKHEKLFSTKFKN